MSKYQLLWEYIVNQDQEKLILTYQQIHEIASIPIDHSFLKYKKELLAYGFEVKKISMKKETVLFIKSHQD